MYTIRMGVLTDTNHYFEIEKDFNNNILVLGLSSEQETSNAIKRLIVRYVIDAQITQTYIIQDIVASELLERRYRVATNTLHANFRVVELEAYIEAKPKI